MFEGRIFVKMENNAADKTEKSESRVRVTTAGSMAHPVPCPLAWLRPELRPAPGRMEEKASLSRHREGTFLLAVTRLRVP